MVDSSHMDLVPVDVLAERCVLGSMLLSPVAAHKTVEALRPDDFYSVGHQTIFTHASALLAETQQIDVVPLRSRLEAAGELEKIGGVTALLDLMEAVPTSANVEYYVALVAEASVKRVVWRQVQKIAEHVDRQTSQEIESALLECIARMQGNRTTQAQSVGDTLAAVIERFEQRATGDNTKAPGLRWGIHEIDDAFDGLQPGRLTVLGATAGCGKTLLATWMLGWNACTLRLPCLFFSAEMSMLDVTENILRQRAGIETRSAMRGQFCEGEYERMEQATTDLREAPLLIDDTPAIEIGALVSRAQRMVRERGIRLVVVDYLQLLTTAERYANYTLQVGDYAKALKTLARTAKIPVLALSQVTIGEDNRVKTRWSTEVEQHADALLLMWRQKQYEGNREPEPDVAERLVAVAKNRFGPQRAIRLQINKGLLRFESLAVSNADTRL